MNDIGSIIGQLNVQCRYWPAWVLAFMERHRMEGDRQYAVLAHRLEARDDLGA